MTIQEIDQLGDKILNEWGINNAKNLGLQACHEALRLAVELEKYKQAEQGGKLMAETPQSCPNCEGKGKTYHRRSCAEDDPTGWYHCWMCNGEGNILMVSEVKHETKSDVL